MKFISLLFVLAFGLNAQTLTINRIPADVVKIQGAGTYMIQSSTNLINWKNLGVIKSGGTAQFINFPAEEKLFYRTTNLASGPLFELISLPTVARETYVFGTSPDIRVYDVCYKIRVTAIGENIWFGTALSANPAFTTNSFSLYENGSLSNALKSVYGMLVSYPVPEQASSSEDGKSFVVLKDQSVDIHVRCSFYIQSPNLNLYSIRLDNATWTMNGAVRITLFGDGLEWKTNNFM